MNIVVTARAKNNDNYDELELQGLSSSFEVSENKSVINVCIENVSDADWEGVVHIKYIFDGQNPKFFLPGFMYGTNRGDAPIDVDTKYPRIRMCEPNMPASPWWMVRSDRLSHPVAIAYCDGKIHSISATPYFVMCDGVKTEWYPEIEDKEFYQYTGYTCSLSDNSIGYTLGYENAPWLFVQSHTIYDRAEMGSNCFVIAKGEKIKFKINYAVYEAEYANGIHKAVEEAYYRFHQEPRRTSDIHTAVKDILEAVSEYAWLEEDKAYSGFVYDSEDGKYTYNKLPSISWTNGLAVAVPALLAAIRTDNDKARNQALCCIQNIVDNSINPESGLPFEACHDGEWSNRGWWFDRMRTAGHSSYLIAQCLYYICKAYSYEITYKNEAHNDWLVFVGDIIDRLEKTKNTDNEYPYILSAKTGAGIEYDSFAGCWCMTAGLYYTWLKQDLTYLDGFKKSENYYYNYFIKHAECYGAPHDTDKATDSEGVLAYIRAVRYLYELTGDEMYLDHMKEALCYEFTFKYSYNSPVKVPPLSKIGWSSCGGSITSVANPHIHPMSSGVVDEMIYYVSKRNDDYIVNRLKDTIMWSCQTYNTYDGEYDYGKKGWMSERFCHSEGLLVEKYKDGSVASTWFALMPWACGCILEALAGECWDYSL